MTSATSQQQGEKATARRATSLLTELVTLSPDVMVVPLTTQEAKLIRTSFLRIADRLEDIGTASFSELFVHHPEAIRIFVSNRVFPETITEVQYSWELKAHALRVMHTFEKIINRLDKPSTIWSAMISDIGCRHAAYNAKPAYLPVLVAAFRHAFFKEFTKAGILTPELSDVWYKLFNNMTVLMTSSVVASFVDSYADYKQNPAILPVWIAGPAPSPSAAVCPVQANGKINQGGQRIVGDQTSSDTNSSQKRGSLAPSNLNNNKIPSLSESSTSVEPTTPQQVGADSPPTSRRSSSQKLKTRFTEFLSFSSTKSSGKTKGDNSSNSNPSPTSSNEDVQIINI